MGVMPNEEREARLRIPSRISEHHLQGDLDYPRFMCGISAQEEICSDIVVEVRKLGMVEDVECCAKLHIN